VPFVQTTLRGLRHTRARLNGRFVAWGLLPAVLVGCFSVWRQDGGSGLVWVAVIALVSSVLVSYNAGRKLPPDPADSPET
jgi:hypothetical protein